jgi:predicted ester cyclase
MGTEENKKIIEQYYATFNKGGDVPFEEYFSSDFLDHNGYAEQIQGPAGVREGYQVWSKAFPDCHAELADMIAEGDKAVVRTIATGTHLE